MSTSLGRADISDFVKFLEDYNRYKFENFRLYYFLNRLWNDISQYVVAQNFIISTCSRYVDIF